jgi:hypothetical protein
LSAGRRLPPGRFLVIIAVRLSRPQGQSAAGRIRSIEKSSDLIGNRTGDLRACSILPQPITLPRAPGGVVAFVVCRSSGPGEVTNFIHVVETDSVTHPTSYTMGTGGSFLGVKRPGREADHSPRASAEVKQMWIYTCTPPYLTLP